MVLKQKFLQHTKGYGRAELSRYSIFNDSNLQIKKLVWLAIVHRLLITN